MMSDLNKHILLVMKWLDDKNSVSNVELVENRDAAYADAAAYAEKWVNKYFKGSGENKQDYIDAIGAGKVSEEPSQEWVPKTGEVCFVEYPYDDGCFKPFHGKKVTILGYCSDNDGDHVFTAHGSDGFIALYANGFRPLKTQKEKDREAFIEKASFIMFDVNGEINDLSLGALFDDGARFKAPEGE